MKNIMIILVMLVSVSLYATDNNAKLGIGDKAVLIDVKMIDVSGESISLADARKTNGLVVIFSCNTCPFVLRWEDRYSDVKALADKNEVGMVVLNSNYQKRSGDDSLEAMKEKAEEMGYKFKYVVDKESQIANAFGGKTTPHVFLFDGDFILAYKGAIDDSHRSADAVAKAYLKDAIVSLGAGEKVAITETIPVGCSIKRKVE